MAWNSDQLTHLSESSSTSQMISSTSDWTEELTEREWYFQQDVNWNEPRGVRVADCHLTFLVSCLSKSKTSRSSWASILPSLREWQGHASSHHHVKQYIPFGIQFIEGSSEIFGFVLLRKAFLENRSGLGVDRYSGVVLFHQHKIVKMESVGAPKTLTRASCAIDVLCLSERRPCFKAGVRTCTVGAGR